MCGLATLTRAEAGLLFVLMIVPVVLTAKGLDPWARLARIGMAAVCVLAVLAPWGIWLRTQFEEPVLVSTNEGLTLAGANCDETYHGDRTGFWSIDCATALLAPDFDASQNSSRLRREAIDYAREHLDRLPVVALAREGRVFGLWRPDLIVAEGRAEGRPTAASWAGLAVFWLMVPISVVGAIQLHRRGVSLLPMLATVISVALVALLFYGIPRQRIGIDVVMCVLTATAVASWQPARRATSELQRA
jgi:4-amino-4-deoxy-L-arabinose transferase-like glycosyltransferase